MWSFKNLLFCLCPVLSSVSSAAGLIHVFGYEGQDVKVSCSYPSGYESYEKYLCNEKCDYSDILITTTQVNKTRHYIYDDKRTKIFTTTISNLLSTDAGTYWCGVSKNSWDIYTEVNLATKQDNCCNTVKNIQGNEDGSVSISCLYDSESVDKLKYICRGNRPSICLQQALITSKSTQNGRFRLTDDRKSRLFTVTIPNLTLKDSGSYLCGVQRNSGLDVFSATELKVKEWCCVKSQNIAKTAGDSVTFKCPYPPNHRNNRKFICKGSHRSSCRDMMMDQNRFLLHSDSSESFSVTIAQLEAGDAGTYWCRSEPGWNVGNYTQFHLSLGKEEETIVVEKLPALKIPPDQHQSNNRSIGQPTAPSVTKPKELIQGIPDAALYSVVVVLPVLLLTVILITVSRKKCQKVKDTKVIACRGKLDFIRGQDVCGGEDVYENHDAMVKRSQQSTLNPQNASSDLNQVEEDEQDYENVTAAEDIYCNEDFHKNPDKMKNNFHLYTDHLC